MLRRAMMAGNTAPSSGVDDFSSDTRSLYAMYKVHGDPVPSISGGVLTITANTSGEEVAYVRTDTSILDGYVESDIDYAPDSGLVGRFVNYSNYYLLTTCDDSGSNPSNNIRIFKCVSGAYNQLGSADITWTRGSQKTIRLSFSGSSIKAIVDGAEVISVTDTGISAAGKIGVRANGTSGTQNRFNELRWG